MLMSILVLAETLMITVFVFISVKRLVAEKFTENDFCACQRK